MAYTPDPHLVFESPASAVTPQLVFGAADAPVSARATLGLAVQLPALRVAMGIGYDNRVQRGPSLVRASAWQVASSAQIGARAHHAQATSLPADRQTAWQLGDLVEAGSSIAIRTLKPCRAAKTGRWQRGAKIEAHRVSAWALLVARPVAGASWWQAGQSASHLTGATWRELDHSKRASVRSRWQTGQPLSASIKDRAGVAAPLIKGWLARWQTGIPPRPGRRWVDPVIPPANPCYTPNTRLVFKGAVASDARLVFACENAVDPSQPQKIIPTRRAYIVINDVSLRRADGAAVLRASSLNLAIDADSWVWSWDAQIDAAQLDAVMPDSSGEQVELIARVNGKQFRLLAEKVARERSFGRRSLKVSGRGLAAQLASPYWPSSAMGNDTALTMQQLGDAALTVNGVGVGWALDWQAADWLVPAGIWACTATPIEALLRLAESAGAYVQADAFEQILHVLPRYKISPWDFSGSSPDLLIPESVFVTEGIEWVDKPAYNAIYVSGDSSGGVLGFAKRLGTAGDVPATMITDALCTHADAVRARALPALADTGRQARVTGSMQVLPESGVISVGSLVQIGSGAEARRGIVRSVRLSAGMPKLRQTLEVECHG